MGLAGEDNLDRPLRIVHQRGEPIQIAHDQVGPLVRGKPAGEADRQNIRIEQIARLFHGFIALAAAAALAAHAAADELQQQVLQRVVRFPQFAGIAAVNFLPDFRLAHVAHPIGHENAIVKLLHLPGQPTRHVHAVGDVADGNFFLHAPRPQVGPHAAGHVAVQRTDGIGPARKFEPQHGHAKAFAFIVRLDAPQAHQLLQRDTKHIAQLDQGALQSVRRRIDRAPLAPACGS